MASIRLRGPWATSPPAQIRACEVRSVVGSVTIPPSAQFEIGVGQAVEVGGLADGEDHRVGGEDLLRSRHEGRVEAVVVVEHRSDVDRLESGDAALLADEAVRARAVQDGDALRFGFGDLLRIGRDLLGRLQRDDGHVEHAGTYRRARHVERRDHSAPGIVLRSGGRPAVAAVRAAGWLCRLAGLSRRRSQRRAGGVERHVSAADDDDPAAELDLEAAVDVEEELDGAQHAVELVTGQIEAPSPARADRDGTATRWRDSRSVSVTS